MSILKMMGKWMIALILDTTKQILELKKVLTSKQADYWEVSIKELFIAR